jgi:hypothetical protein
MVTVRGRCLDCELELAREVSKATFLLDSIRQNLAFFSQLIVVKAKRILSRGQRLAQGLNLLMACGQISLFRLEAVLQCGELLQQAVTNLCECMYISGVAEELCCRCCRGSPALLSRTYMNVCI